MTPRSFLRHVAAAGGLWRIGDATAAWAHHPIPRPDSGGEWTSVPLWFLGVGVFMVAFAVTWVVFSFLDRRQRSESSEPDRPRRS